jgi:hypothetical protein
VTKHIIEYKGLEGVRGLPLITIGGERMPRGPREKRLPREEKPEERKKKRVEEMTLEELEKGAEEFFEE